MNAQINHFICPKRKRTNFPNLRSCGALLAVHEATPLLHELQPQQLRILAGLGTEQLLAGLTALRSLKVDFGEHDFSMREWPTMTRVMHLEMAVVLPSLTRCTRLEEKFPELRTLKVHLSRSPSIPSKASMKQLWNEIIPRRIWQVEVSAIGCQDEVRQYLCEAVTKDPWLNVSLRFL